MELGPDLIALLTRLQGLDPVVLDGLLGNPVGAAGDAPGGNPALAVPAPPIGARVVVSSPPLTILEKFGPPAADPLLPHYGTLIPPFARVYPGNEAARLSDVLSFIEEERPILVVGVIRNNIPELTPLWGPTRHLDPPYARTAIHDAHVFFCRDVVQGNLPASTTFNGDWLVTESLELLSEALFEAKVVDSPLGADFISEQVADEREDAYVAQAAVVPACLVPDLLRLPRNPLAAWRLLRARAAELGLLEVCSPLWLLLRALASPAHREESCVSLDIVDGNAHFINTRRGTLEAILPALAAGSPMPPPAHVGEAVGTASLAAAIAAATRPASQKVVTVEEKWPHSYRRLLLLVGVPGADALHDFWHDYANQKKAQRWAYVQSATSAMAESLGLESPTIVAKTVEVLDSLVFAGASEDSLNEGLTIWQFPALTPADTDSVNESLRSWEGLLTGSTSMSLADVKEVLRVGKVGAPQSWLHACAQLEHWTVVMATVLGAGHSTVAWLLSLARLARSKALVFDRQVAADPQLPLAVLARVHLTFHAFFESVQGGGPPLLPELSGLIRELRERRLVCPRLPPSMQRLVRGAPAPAVGSPAPAARGSVAAINPASVARLQIAAGRNLGNCIRTAAAAGEAIPLTDNGGRSFCLAYHYVGRCNQNCGGSPTHRVLSRSEEQRLHAWKVRWVDPPVPRDPAPPLPRSQPRPAPLPRAPAPAPGPVPWPTAPSRPATPVRERRPPSPGRDRPPSPRT
jgi:hypothetical protein